MSAGWELEGWELWPLDTTLGRVGFKTFIGLWLSFACASFELYPSSLTVDESGQWFLKQCIKKNSWAAWWLDSGFLVLGDFRIQIGKVCTRLTWRFSFSVSLEITFCVGYVGRWWLSFPPYRLGSSVGGSILITCIILTLSFPWDRMGSFLRTSLSLGLNLSLRLGYSVYDKSKMDGCLSSELAYSLVMEMLKWWHLELEVLGCVNITVLYLGCGWSEGWSGGWARG